MFAGTVHVDTIENRGPLLLDRSIPVHFNDTRLKQGLPNVDFD
jgi:hypothetical protein